MTSLQPGLQGRRPDRRGDPRPPTTSTRPRPTAGGRGARLGRASRIPRRAPTHYPHEFSGGMRQRAMIAMALALEPAILIADEPTTALDVTIQAQILRAAQGPATRSAGLAVILITHDLGVVAEVADRVLVMYAGQIVEQGTLDEIFYDPQHPYTWGLLGSLARLDQRARRAAAADRRPAAVAARAARRAAASARAARTRSRSAPSCRRSRQRLPRAQRPRRPLLARARGQEATLREVEGRIGTGGRRPDGQGRSDCSRSSTSSSTSRSSAGSSDRPRGGQRHAVDDVSLTLHEGETLGPGRRVGLRQVDALPDDPAAARADLGLGPVRGQGARRALAQGRCGRCAARCR